VSIMTFLPIVRNANAFREPRRSYDGWDGRHSYGAGQSREVGEGSFAAPSSDGADRRARAGESRNELCSGALQAPGHLGILLAQQPRRRMFGHGRENVDA